MRNIFKKGIFNMAKKTAEEIQAEADAKALAEAQKLVDAQNAKKNNAAAPKPKKGSHTVAKGVSITTKRRTVLSEGEIIKVDDVSSTEAFDTLIKAKKIVKN